jgi:hypothetical protein
MFCNYVVICMNGFTFLRVGKSWNKDATGSVATSRYENSHFSACKPRVTSSVSTPPPHPHPLFKFRSSHSISKVHYRVHNSAPLVPIPGTDASSPHLSNLFHLDPRGTNNWGNKANITSISSAHTSNASSAGRAE